MKSRQVSCGFLANQIERVSEWHVHLDDGKTYRLEDLNGREDDEIQEFRNMQKQLEAKS